MIDSIKEVYKEKRRKIEEGCQVIYDQAVRLAGKGGKYSMYGNKTATP